IQEHTTCRDIIRVELIEMIGANIALIIHEAVDVLLDVIEILGIPSSLVHFFQGFQDETLLIIPTGGFAHFDRDGVGMGVHDARRHLFGIVLAFQNKSPYE
ncbi:MAG: hypothetical protein RLZZ185_869, partial [Bacteroidota bacterium]